MNKVSAVRRVRLATQLAIALLLGVVMTATALAQVQGTLRLTVSLLDAARQPVPVPRHSLLISDNPATAAPRRVVTGADGKVDVRLRPGNYTVESEEPVAFDGKAYEWTIDVDVRAGVEATLVLNASNAAVGDAGPAAPNAPASRASSPSIALQAWKPAVFALWTPTSRASGFLVDPRGLVATSAGAIGGQTSVAVQLSPTLKVTGAVVAADAAANVAVVRIGADSAAGIRPLSVTCPAAPKPPVEGDELFALGVPLRALQDTLSAGEVKRADGPRVEADLRIPAGGAGGPVFSEASELVGLSALPPAGDDTRRRLFPVVALDSLCALLPRAEAALTAGKRPSPAHLPVDPLRPTSLDALAPAVAKRGGDLNAYQISSSDFDLAFITPVMTYAAQHPPADRRTTSRDTHRSLDEEVRTSRQMEFGAWSDYVADVPPVLLVRVTPKMAEGFWRGLVRGAAMTQGIQLPPMKSAKAEFSRMQAYCGPDEVTPIHALVIDTPVSDTQTFREGLYVFAPGALRAGCGSVKLVLYSAKEPDKGDPRTVDAAIVTRIDKDFADMLQP